MQAPTPPIRATIAKPSKAPPVIGSKKISRRNLTDIIKRAAEGATVGGGLGYVVSKSGYKGGRIGAAVGGVAGILRTEMSAQRTGAVVGHALLRLPRPILLARKLGHITHFDARINTSDFLGMIGGGRPDKKTGERDWFDILTRSNAYGGRSTLAPVVKGAEMAKNLAGDAYDAYVHGGGKWSKRRRYIGADIPGDYEEPTSARVQNFKLTPNSRNTARITVGPDQRERRGKREWEKVGFQRRAAQVGTAAALVAGSAIANAASKYKMGGNLAHGLLNLGAKQWHRVKNAGRGFMAAEGRQVPAFVPPFGPTSSMRNRVPIVGNIAKAQKATERAAKKAAKAEKDKAARAKKILAWPATVNTPSE